MNRRLRAPPPRAAGNPAAPATSPPAAPAQPMRVRTAAAVLLLAVLAAYANSLGGPFVFDDIPAIVENPAIRQLWPLGPALWPDLPGGVTTNGRPLVNLSLALNYAFSGNTVWSYHVVNVAIHASAALLLFGLIRRTLLLPGLQPRWQSVALPIATAGAALWALHPLQTSAVTYVVQRAESLMALCYLLTLYSMLRMTTAPHPRRWHIVAVGACLAGMVTKEVMASAPLLALLYDRTFLSGSFKAAWRARGRLHLALMSSWIVLLALVVAAEGRGGTAGLATEVSPLRYLATQADALVHYLQLVAWPAPLVFDYGTPLVEGFGEVWWQALLIVALLATTAWTLRRHPAIGFAGAWFFAVLAPSSSVVPIATQTMAEHRLYLALAAPIALAVAVLIRRGGRPAIALLAAMAVIAALGTATRNRTYADPVRLWADTAAKRPENARAHHNLGLARLAAGETAAAEADLLTAHRLRPQEPETLFNLGLVSARQGRWPEAISRYEAALARVPDYPEALNNLGLALLRSGSAPDAIIRYRAALQLRPAAAEIHANLADALLVAGDAPAAVEAARDAVQHDPTLPAAHFNLANALAALGRFADAERAYRSTLTVDPTHARAFTNLGNILLEQDRVPEAVQAWERAVALDPALASARRNLAFVLVHLGRTTEARRHFMLLLQADPRDEQARAALRELM